MIAPPLLKKGDTVAVVALASKVDLAELEPAINVLRKDWELNLIIGESVKSDYFSFAGNDEIRQNDFQQLLDNQEVKAIFSARGGYGSSRFIDKINFEKFKKNPKWVVGFSDITEVLNKIQTLGFQALHAAMPKTFMRDYASRKSLQNVLFGNKLDYKIPANVQNRIGIGHGIITGGNLCLLSNVIGTTSEIDYSGKILFIEDVGEYPYTIDRMMVHLKRANKLKNLAGLIVGSFSSMKENDEPFGKSVYEIIAEHTAEFKYPVCYGFPVGHEAENWAIPCGRTATLSLDNEEVTLIFDDKTSEIA